MDALNSADMLLLGTFRFDRRSRTLSRLDTGSQIPLGSRAIDVLGVLLERAGDLVPKDDIMQAVWPEMVVEEANLTVHISTLRRVLDAGPVEGSCIQTISGRGYRFIGGVIRPELGPATGAGGGCLLGNRLDRGRGNHATGLATPATRVYARRPDLCSCAFSHRGYIGGGFNLRLSLVC